MEKAGTGWNCGLSLWGASVFQSSLLAEGRSAVADVCVPSARTQMQTLNCGLKRPRPAVEGSKQTALVNLELLTLYLRAALATRPCHLPSGWVFTRGHDPFPLSQALKPQVQKDSVYKTREIMSLSLDLSPPVPCSPPLFRLLQALLPLTVDSPQEGGEGPPSFFEYASRLRARTASQSRRQWPKTEQKCTLRSGGRRGQERTDEKA